MISLPPAKMQTCKTLQDRRIIITSMKSIAVIHPLSCCSCFVGCGLISPPSVAGPGGAYLQKYYSSSSSRAGFGLSGVGGGRRRQPSSPD
jgi:hypothetical protein